MALTIKNDSHEGSGEFVQETAWSCPYHDRDVNPISDYGESDPEWEEGEFCLTCESGGWKKVWNADGTPKMRELTNGDVLMRDMYLALLKCEMRQHETLKKMMKMDSKPGTKYVWLEDDL